MSRRCNPIIYRMHTFVLNNNLIRHVLVDCEQHEHSYHTPLFADAVAEAMIHRYEASNGVPL